MSDIKYLDDPAKFLLDSGLLFEINRRILHPLGLAMSVAIDADDSCTFGPVWDYRNDPEGLIYDDETLRHGKAKVETFLREFGYLKFAEREELLGYVVQGQ